LKFKLIPDNPSVASSANTSSYSHSEPMFVRGAIRFNQGAPTASTDVLQRSSSYFAKMTQFAPQSDANIAANPATVRWGQFMHSNEAPRTYKSLAELVGFEQEKVKMGKTATSRTITEAIIAIPYVVDEGVRNYLNLNKAEIDKYLFEQGIISINRSPEATTPTSTAPVVRATEVGVSDRISPAATARPGAAITSVVESTPEAATVLDPAVVEQIEKMQKYSLPPHLDFINHNVNPVPMYIFEFTKDLSRSELNDLWQGVRSETLNVTSFDQKKITHVLSSESLLGALNNIEGETSVFINPEHLKNLKWLVFKAKKKANTNYNNKMRNDLVINSAATPPQVELTSGLRLGYNWPYDYFSLVENAKMSVNVELANVGELPDISAEQVFEGIVASESPVATDPGALATVGIQIEAAEEELVPVDSGDVIYRVPSPSGAPFTPPPPEVPDTTSETEGMDPGGSGTGGLGSGGSGGSDPFGGY